MFCSPCSRSTSSLGASIDTPDTPPSLLIAKRSCVSSANRSGRRPPNAEKGVHEVAPDQIVPIADAAGVIGVAKEEQPGVADAAGGQHGEPRLDGHRPVRSDESAGAADAAAPSSAISSATCA